MHAESGWRRVEPDLVPCGAIGGDVQVGDGWWVSWQRALPDGMTAQIARAFYLACDEDCTLGAPACDPPPGGVVGRAAGLRIVCQSEYLLCTDSGDPGGSETWREYTYLAEPDGSYPLDARGVRQAAEQASVPTDTEWHEHVPDWATG